MVGVFWFTCGAPPLTVSVVAILIRNQGLELDALLFKDLYLYAKI